jgi:hypothetical protein
LQDPPKFIQNWIFGLKTNHLETLIGNREAFPTTNRVARFFLVHDTKNGNNVPKVH